MTNNCPYETSDFASGQEVRWCPGCGNHAILNSLKSALTKIGKKKEDIVFISGIGCSSRLPYYLNTFGLHTIHGRAPGFASGLKIHNPNLSIWIITGDGDGLSIGGNHIIHLLRRNIDVNVILFNNEIFGLTKGQYSPTSKPGTITKSSPYGSLDRSFSPVSLALGVGATFVAKTLDTDPKHMEKIFLQAEQHRGTSFVEILQNCIIFNDKAHHDYTHPKKRSDNLIYVEDKKPLIFGANLDKGICWHKFRPQIISSQIDTKQIDTKEDNNSLNYSNIPSYPVFHDVTDLHVAHMLCNLSRPTFPVAVGVLYDIQDHIYDLELNKEIEQIQQQSPQYSIEELFRAGDCWEIK